MSMGTDGMWWVLLFFSCCSSHAVVRISIAYDDICTSALSYCLQPAPPRVWLGPALPEAMGIFAVALSGPSGSALPTLRSNMKQPLRFKRVLLIALGVMTALYAFVGSVGYFYFGSDASQLITVDLETKSLLSHLRLFGVIRVSVCFAPNTSVNQGSFGQQGHCVEAFHHIVCSCTNNRVLSPLHHHVFHHHSLQCLSHATCIAGGRLQHGSTVGVRPQACSLVAGCAV